MPDKSEPDLKHVCGHPQESMANREPGERVLQTISDGLAIPTITLKDYRRRLQKAALLESLWGVLRGDILELRDPFENYLPSSVGVPSTIILVITQNAGDWPFLLASKSQAIDAGAESRLQLHHLCTHDPQGRALGSEELRKGCRALVYRMCARTENRTIESSGRPDEESEGESRLLSIHLVMDLAILRKLRLSAMCKVIRQSFDSRGAYGEIVLHTCSASAAAGTSLKRTISPNCVSSNWLGKEFGSHERRFHPDIWFHLADAGLEEITQLIIEFVLLYAHVPELRDRILSAVPGSAIHPRAALPSSTICISSYGLASLESLDFSSHRFPTDYFWDMARPKWRARDECFYVERRAFAFLVGDKGILWREEHFRVTHIACSQQPTLLRIDTGMSPYHVEGVIAG